MKYAKKFKLNEAKNPEFELTKDNVTAMNKFIKDQGIKASLIKPTTVDNKFRIFDTIQLPTDTKSIGPLSMVFNTMDVEIAYGKSSNPENEDILFLLFKYMWEHPNGSNGYTITWMTKDGGKNWVDRNKGF